MFREPWLIISTHTHHTLDEHTLKIPRFEQIIADSFDVAESDIVGGVWVALVGCFPTRRPHTMRQAATNIRTGSAEWHKLEMREREKKHKKL